MIFRPVSFRPAFGKVLTGGVAATGMFALATFVIAGNWDGLVRYGWTVAFLIALVGALFWFPRIDVLEHEVVVRNVFVTFHVPWPAIERVDTKFALTLYTPQGRIAVWASPAPNRYSVFTTTAGDARLVSESGRGPGGSIRPGDALDTDSGAVANIIRRRWEQLRDDGFLDSPVIEDGALRREWNRRTIVVLAVLLCASAAGILL